MDILELNKEIKRIEKEAKKELERKRNALYRRFREENAKYKIGDIISCKDFSIIIDTVGLNRWMAEEPYIVYGGVILTKKGQKRKDRAIGSIPQKSIEEEK